MLGVTFSPSAGVYGWQNSTFSILAALDEGFLAPMLLLDQAPQSGFVALGAYKYYRYHVSTGGVQGAIPVAIKFTLTPTDGGDPDLYAVFSNHTEPGRESYDYRSSSYSSVTDTIEVSHTMAHYCLNCEVLLAVYGFKQSAYSLQASSTGMTQLQADVAVGDAVGMTKWNYYSFYNAEPFAEMKFTLTSVRASQEYFHCVCSP